MGIVTSINWFWNFFISITWPKFQTAFTPSGAFGWYAAWCAIGWWMILLFVPETKDLTLEQLDQVRQPKRLQTHTFTLLTAEPGIRIPHSGAHEAWHGAAEVVHRTVSDG